MKIIIEFLQSWMSFSEEGEEELKGVKGTDQGTQSSNSEDEGEQDVTMSDETRPGPSNQSDLRQHIETLSRQMMAQMDELRGKKWNFMRISTIEFAEMTSALQRTVDVQNETEADDDQNIEVD